MRPHAVTGCLDKSTAWHRKKCSTRCGNSKKHKEVAAVYVVYTGVPSGSTRLKWLRECHPLCIMCWNVRTRARRLRAAFVRTDM